MAWSFPRTPGRSAGRRRSPAAAALASALSVLLAAGNGCGVVPRSKLDDCRQLSQSLRSDNGRLKDVALDLRAQNQDLTQRAVDDAKRLTAQNEALERLEKSVIAYQSERDQLAAAFDDLKRQVRVSVGPRPDQDVNTSATDAPAGPAPVAGAAADPAGPAPVAAFAASGAGAGWSYDPESRTLSADADAVFRPGTARVGPDAEASFAALTAALKKATDGGGMVEVVGLAGDFDDSVQRAGLPGQDGGGNGAPGGDPAVSRRFLAAARAATVRDRLVTAGGLEAGRVRMAHPEPAGAGRSAVLLRLVPAAALDAGEGAPR